MHRRQSLTGISFDVDSRGNADNDGDDGDDDNDDDDDDDEPEVTFSQPVSRCSSRRSSTHRGVVCSKLAASDLANAAADAVLERMPSWRSMLRRDTTLGVPKDGRQPETPEDREKEEEEQKVSEPMAHVECLAAVRSVLTPPCRYDVWCVWHRPSALLG